MNESATDNTAKVRGDCQCTAALWTRFFFDSMKIENSHFVKKDSWKNQGNFFGGQQLESHN